MLCERINPYIKFCKIKRKRGGNYRGKIKKTLDHIQISFRFPGSLSFSDLGATNYEIIFRIHPDLLSKYFVHHKAGHVQPMDLDILFPVAEFPICHTIHTNLICLLQAESRGQSRNRFIENYLMFLLYQVLLISQKMGCPCTQCSECKITNQKVEEVRQWLERHPETSITIQDFEKKVGLSSDLMDILFFQKYQKGIFDYLFEIRMKLAERWLATRVVRISEVAKRCGFSSEKIFTETFQYYLGRMPVPILQN